MSLSKAATAVAHEEGHLDCRLLVGPSSGVRRSRSFAGPTEERVDIPDLGREHIVSVLRRCRNFQLPGGMAEENKAPWDAAKREVKEETGLEVQLLRVLVVDRVPRHETTKVPAGCNFVYQTAPQAGDIAVRLPAAVDGREPELLAYKAIAPDEHDAHCCPSQAQCVTAALQAARTGSVAELRYGAPAPYTADAAQALIPRQRGSVTSVVHEAASPVVGIFTGNWSWKW